MRPIKEIEKNKPITAPELFCITVNTLLGSGIYFLPSFMAQNVGRDGWLLWLMVLPAALLIAFLLCLASRSAFRSEGIACKIAEGVYTLVALFLCAFSLAMMSALVGRLLLPSTPTPVIMLLLSVPLWYALPYGVRAMARLNTVMSLCFLLLFLCFALSAANFEPANLRPVFTPSQWSSFPRAALLALAGLSGLLAIPVYCSATEKKQKTAVLSATALSVAGHSVISLLCVGVLGVQTVAASDLPALLTIQYGSFALFPKLFFTALFFNLLLIKPTLNCGYSGFFCLERILKPARPRVLCTFYVLAVFLSACGILTWLKPFA